MRYVMTGTSPAESVAGCMQRINCAWLDGKLDDLAPLLHEEIVMVFPGFQGCSQGREAFIAGFADTGEGQELLFHV
jgi:hypothetical protein